MRKIIALEMILGFSAVASAQELETYLCVTDQAVGFAFNEDTRVWEIL